MHGNRRNPSADEINTLTGLFKQGLIDEAETLSTSLTSRFPKHGFAWKVLGAVYQAQERYEDSLHASRRAIALLPNDAAIFNNLGIALLKLDKLDDAEVNFRKALAIAPDYAKALNNLGALLRTQGKLQEAEVCCRRALEIDPLYANAHTRLGNILESQDRISEATASYRAALAITPSETDAHTNLLHLLSHDIQIEPRQLFAEHLAFGEQFETPLRASWQAHSNDKNPDRRLEIGFVTGDLYNHALANFLDPLFKELAKNQKLSLHAYFTNTFKDAVTQRLRIPFAHWHEVALLSDLELVKKIRADRIDILFDLSGHSAKNRLLAFARKPAPIQISWLGHLGTTGLQAMDYYLCDKFWIPPGELDWQFTEKLAYLPSAVVFQPSVSSPPLNSLPALENGYVTFGSFNRTNKLNASVISLWSMLLRSIPTAKMVLGAIPLTSQDQLITSFANEGIERNRLVFFQRTNTRDYLALHQQIDFCLDTFPHGGGATTAHALWMGVPTLSLAGESPASRFGATLMHILGLDAFIATSIEEFVHKGSYWAEHLDDLSTIRRNMRERFMASPLGQTELYAANFETLLRTMWQRWCSNLPPAMVEVQAQQIPTNTNSAEQDEPSPQELDELALLFSEKRYVEAESFSRLLVSRFPEHGYAWKILGSVLFSQGKLEESLAIQKKTVELRPNDYEAHFNLAYGLHEQGYLDDAVKSYFLSLGIQPINAMAYCNLGNILKVLGFLPDAEAYCREAIALEPNMANAHNNLGNVLQAQGRYVQAQASYRRALTLKPEWAAAYNNLAITLKDQGNWSEAKVCYRKALTIAPDWAVAHNNLLYCLSHDVQTEPQQLLAEHLAFGDQFEAPLRLQWKPHENTKDPERCLQIGFISGDLYDHALSNFTEPLFKFLAQKQTLSLHVYYTRTIDDAVTQRMRAYFAHWHAISNLSDGELANKIRADGIDILIDLGGHTANNRLLTFARKPAPIQISYLGYLGTTGLKAMDYYLCDKFWIPAGELDWQFTEKPAYLPAAVVFQPSEFSPPVNDLPAIKNGVITFGSFNRINKLNDSVIVLWSMLLRKIPDARMLLGAIPPESQNDLIQIFEHEGVDKNRLIFFPRSKLPDYLALHHQVDFCLDTFPYGGGATTAHAAWMGIPTLSLAGESPASRFGATEMHILGLDEFIATSIDDFVAKGSYWAEHIDELASIRGGMRARFKSSALGQPELFASNFEAILRTMWQHWCSNLPVATIESQNITNIKPVEQVAPNQAELDHLADLLSQKHYEEVESAALALTNRFPEHGYAWKILGNVYQALSRHEDSLAPMLRAIALQPSDASSHNNLGMSLLLLERLAEAESHFRTAISIDPHYGKAFVNLGTLLRLQGKLVEAEICCRQAIGLDSCDASAHINLGNALEAQGRLSEAQASYYRADMAHEPRRSVAHSNVLYLLSHDVVVESQELFAEHLAFGELFESPLRGSGQTHGNGKDPSRLLQVGFISGDFCDHALAPFFEPLFKFLSKKQNVSIHAYYSQTTVDAITQRMHDYFVHWHAVGHLSDAHLSEKIRADGIDILIDLSGHTAKNRLLTFARKPAPIQVSWLGYLGTTGLKAMDYYLCDKFWIPPGELDWQFTEKPAYLPAAMVFQPSEFSPPVNTLPALENGFITFGSFNRTNKLNESVIVLWSMLLRSIPTARLLLGAIPLDNQEALIQSFVNEGIEPCRLTFYPRSNIQDYLALHHQVDFCLDTFPHSGGATTAHAVWMGVPTLSLAGESPQSRFGATMMHHLDLNGFIATSIEEFISQGCYWAEHINELATIRLGMRARFNASALGQPELFASHFESILRAMWVNWCSDSPVEKIEPLNFDHPYLSPSNSSAKKNAESPPINIWIVSATKLSAHDFWESSALGVSLQRHLKKNSKLSTHIYFENSTGLPEIFNHCINQAEEDAIMVFIHDDVWIDELNFSKSVREGLSNFDIIGVAGNIRRIKNQPAWMFLDQQLTRDDKSNLSGLVAHGKNPFGQASYFGTTPAKCELLDGVFLAVRKDTLNKASILFDNQFDFHFYDMDFCRSATQAGLSLGTWPIRLTHQSGGAFGSALWRKRCELYLNKWESDLNNISISDHHSFSNVASNLEATINDLLKSALKLQSTGSKELASHIYLEILRIQPTHPEANYYLGWIELNAGDSASAENRLKICVLEKPEIEKYWISYIKLIMSTGSESILTEAIALGQRHGLQAKSAQELLKEYADRNAGSTKFLITTLIPAYKPAYMAELLLCLSRQTYKLFKVIISDDSPNGEITQLINSAEFSSLKNSLNIEIFEGPKNGGFTNITSMVRQHAEKANFFHILMDDDIIYPTFYENHMREHALTQSNCSISARWRADQYGQPVNLSMDNVTSQNFSKKFNAKSIFKELVPTCNNKLGEWSNTIFRKEAIPSILEPGIGNISYFGLNDFGSFIHATTTYDGIWIPAPLGFFRVHSEQNTGQLNNSTIKCAHFAWIAFAIIGYDNNWLDDIESWKCISTIGNAIKARYSHDATGSKIISTLIRHTEYGNKFKEEFLQIWNSYLHEIKMQQILDGDLTIKLL